MESWLQYNTKFMVILIVPFALILVLFLSGTASAHRPLFAGTKANDPQSAIRIPDPSVSHVVYAELTEQNPHLWFVFDNDQPQQVPVMLGIPSAVGSSDVKPLVVLFGPGWPELPEALPFAPPEAGGGAKVISVDERPHTFYEPITGTESHILIDSDVQLPQAGTFYGVVYEPNGRTGKVWVSIGESEGFSWRDIARLPRWIGQARQFHEVSGWPRWAWMGTLGLLVIGLSVTAWVRLR